MDFRKVSIILALFLILCSCSTIMQTQSATTEESQAAPSAGLEPENTADPDESKSIARVLPEDNAPISSDEYVFTDPMLPLLDDMAAYDSVHLDAAQDSSSYRSIQADLDEALELCNISQEFWQKGELEKAVTTLDQAYALILHVDVNNDPKLMRQKEDLRFMISKRILEIYASRNTVAKGQYDAIPVVLNKYVKAEIEFLTRGKSFEIAYRRSGQFRPHIVQELKKAGLPVELSWLPLIESSFRVNALSPARALGLWQFIPSTGYKFGLKRDRFIDERLDPEKSTKAAIAYLKELHQIFGDWATVLAAYNCGEGRVLSVIRSQNVNYLDNFWDLYERLPRETARYVPRFLATLHIISNSKKYGLDKIQVDLPPEYEKLTVSKQVSLKDAAETIGVSHETLTSLNPELRQGIVPPSQYPLKVPAGKAKVLLAKLNELPESTASAPPKATAKRAKTVQKYTYHRVRRGESLSTIAGRYGTSMKSIMQANRMHKKHYIVAGKILKIPTGRSVQSGSTGTSRQTRVVKHVVKKGDSLWIIARKYGTGTKTLKRINNLRTSRLRIGQVVKVPLKSGNRNSLKAYKVRHGDVPVEIARRHNMSLERFLKVNRLTHRSKIFPGQKLYVE